MSASESTFGSFERPLLGRLADGPRADAASSSLVAVVLLAATAFFTQANFRVSDMTSFSFDMQIALRLVLCAAGGVYGALKLPHTARWLFKTPGLWILLFGIWSLATAVLATEPLHAIAGSLMLCCAVLFTPAALYELGPRRVLQTLLLSQLAFLVGSWFFFFFVPSVGYYQYILEGFEDSNRLGGLGHPNSTGRIAALTLVLLFVFRARYRTPWRTLFWPLVFVFVSVWWAGSRTALLAGAAAILVANRRSLPPVALLFLAALAITLPLGWLAFGGEVDELFERVSRTGDAAEIYELNGRMPLWEWIVLEIADKPITGFGYACQRFVLPGFGEDWAIAHAHNLFLQVALGTGITGFFFFAATVASLLSGLFRQPSAFPDAFLTLVLVAGVADVSLFTPVPDSFTLCWLLSLFWREPDVVERDALGEGATA
jgi:O-antigen ligase